VKLKVHGTLFPDVRVQISHVQWTPESSLNGVEIVLESSTGKVRILRLRPS